MKKKVVLCYEGRIISKNIGLKEMEENKKMGALRMKATDASWGFL